MKLAAKIAVALVLCIAFILFQSAQSQTEEATTRFAKDMLDDAVTTARLFRPTIARAWRTEGQASAMYLVVYTNEMLKAEEVKTKMRIRWVWLNDTTEADARPRIPLAELGEVLAGKEESHSIVDDDGEARLYTYVPVDVGIEGEPPGALEVIESLGPLQSFREAAAKQTRRAALILAATTAAVIIFVGFWFVGRPVRDLAATADEIGRGNLSARAKVRRGDELGRLALTMNSMADRLEEARANAERESAARIRVLQQLRHADRLKSVGTFASGIAHELGTPLAVIAGRAKLIADGTVSGDDVLKYAESIATQSAKVTTIIRGLLDFARRRSVTLTPKNLTELVAETISLLEPMARKSNVVVDFREKDDSIELNADGVQLQQVITNLIVNAIDAMPGGGTITIDMGTRVVTPPLEHGGPRDEFTFLEVSDEGSGIATEHMKQVFEPFFTTKPVGQGTGLGLAVSYGIIAEHSGWIDVTSQVGDGSCFSVYLPLKVGRSDRPPPSGR